MLVISLDIDKAAIKEFGELGGKHLPFAAARALTWTTMDAQKEALRLLPLQFILRNKYLQNLLRMEPATKTNWSTKVGFRTSAAKSTDFMERQQSGGIKTPLGKMLAIPSKARTNKKGLIKKGQKPSDLLKKDHVFLGYPNGGGRPLGIYARSGHHRLTMMYLLVPLASIKQRLELDKTVNKTVNQRFQRLFALSMDQAIKSSK